MTLELPYIAGLFDGEGWITINKYHHKKKNHIRYQLIIGISLTDRPMIEALAAQFGGLCRSYTNPKRPTHRRVWTWRVSSRAAVPFLQGILPWLRIKKAQATLALAFQDHMSTNRNTFRYTPASRPALYEYRDGVLTELKRLHKVSYDLDVSGARSAEAA